MARYLCLFIRLEHLGEIVLLVVILHLQVLFNLYWFSESWCAFYSINDTSKCCIFKNLEVSTSVMIVYENMKQDLSLQIS